MRVSLLWAAFTACAAVVMALVGYIGACVGLGIVTVGFLGNAGFMAYVARR
ncbi:MAG TPA: hypothetical protein VME46_07380 [Acidimicrobiales bacterium]|nr:hypothetical protein [Acidimicrobiales bacterium]